MNPFYFGGEVRGKDFCNREKEIKELIRDIESGVNVLIYASRRYGKTSLLKELIGRFEGRRDVKVAYMDMFPIVDEESFLREYFNKIVYKFEGTTDKIIRHLKEVLRFKPSFKMQIDEKGEVSYIPEIKKDEKKIIFEEILNLPFIYSKQSKKKFLIVFDEFQQASELSMEAKLRTVIQTHGRDVSYIFSGSKKSTLKRIFINAKTPFYRSVKHFPLNPITENEWMPFITQKFKETGKKIDKGLIIEILHIAELHPYYIQHLCYVVWDVSNKNVEKKDLEQALNIVFEREKDTFWYVWESLTEIQKKTLTVIVNTEGKDIYSKEILEKYSLSPANIQKSIKSLLERDIIDKQENKITLENPVMKLWLKMQPSSK